MVWLEITGVSQILKGDHHHQTSLFTPEYRCILYGRMRFDDVCLILKMYVEINVILMIECMYKYVLANTAHTHT